MCGSLLEHTRWTSERAMARQGWEDKDRRGNGSRWNCGTANGRPNSAKEAVRRGGLQNPCPIAATVLGHVCARVRVMAKRVSLRIPPCPSPGNYPAQNRTS